MKKCLFFVFLAAVLSLCSLTSCGGDEDELMSENLIGEWQGTFVVADTLDGDAVFSSVDDVILSFSYPYIVVRGKRGVGQQKIKNDVSPFDWEIKYGKLFLNFHNHPEHDLEIWSYKYPVDSVFEGTIEDIAFRLQKR